MIIRLTVRDNDFGDLIDNYFQNFFYRMTGHYGKKPEKDDFSGWLSWQKKEEEMNQLLNPNLNERFTRAQKQIIISRVIETFHEYIECTCTDNSTIEYLKNQLQVEFLWTMMDKWENGEAWYWFQHSKVVINQ